MVTVLPGHAEMEQIEYLMVALLVFDAEYAEHKYPDDGALVGPDDGSTEGPDGAVDELRYANHCDLALSP